MVLEFLSEADASSAFKINNAGDLLNKIKEHPLFDKFEINRYARPALPPRWTTYRDSDSFNIFIFYYSGLEKQYVRRRSNGARKWILSFLNRRIFRKIRLVL